MPRSRRCSSSSGSATPAARPVASVPAARCLEGLHLHLRPGSPAEGDRITGMWLNGEPIDPATTYSVTVNSFLASGGDNFRGVRRRHAASGTPARSTCRRWSTTWTSSPASRRRSPVDYSQRAVGRDVPGRRSGVVPAGRPRDVRRRRRWRCPTRGRRQGHRGRRSRSATTSLGTFPVDNTIGTAVFDEYGTASVDVVLPAGTPGGTADADGHGRHDRHRGPGAGPGHRARPTTITADGRRHDVRDRWSRSPWTVDPTPPTGDGQPSTTGTRSSATGDLGDGNGRRSWSRATRCRSAPTC